jgi:hypothetical protein
MGKARYILQYGFLLRGTPALMCFIMFLLFFVQPSAITSFVVTYLLYAFVAACTIAYLGAHGDWHALEQRFGYDDSQQME